ncbi:hypothetical protein [Pseudophaeobacter flagellatus]|uniref:hypothetical protein n=1 Tax=Pseudophaeobacter flagellatus TaxID=2899119 RepID=UPI001E44D472|nr:hypothetical protein [Pseudophaeobacter flagellatus]MCD9149884.1 hypothetical protein [Pseudophaeobacter flagellatus]
MNTLTYKVKPSESSNDHEVRLLVDGADVLGDAYLGLDPVDFRRSVGPETSDSVLVGRCQCGCVGCDDVAAQVTFGDHEVTWLLLGKTYRFAIDAYKSILEGFASDHTWEDIGRRVERILTERVRSDARWVAKNTRFDWVSTRCSQRQLTYSFTIDGQQITFSTGWDGQTEESAIVANSRVLFERYSEGS